jgi:hypothetical protein
VSKYSSLLFSLSPSLPLSLSSPSATGACSLLQQLCHTSKSHLSFLLSISTFFLTFFLFSLLSLPGLCSLFLCLSLRPPWALPACLPAQSPRCSHSGPLLLCTLCAALFMLCYLPMATAPGLFPQSVASCCPALPLSAPDSACDHHTTYTAVLSNTTERVRSHHWSSFCITPANPEAGKVSL